MFELFFKKVFVCSIFCFCSDSLQRHLHAEALELRIGMERIQVQIQQTKLAFHQMQAHQVLIEEGINVKTNSIAIDETLVQPLRKQISIQLQ